MAESSEATPGPSKLSFAIRRRAPRHRPAFLASPGLMWIRQKTQRTQGKGSEMATDEKVASKHLEIKALRMDTSLEDKFWLSITSISRVSAGKMQTIWCMSRHNFFAKCM